jgi:hypothetical protein
LASPASFGLLEFNLNRTTNPGPFCVFAMLASAYAPIMKAENNRTT